MVAAGRQVTIQFKTEVIDGRNGIVKTHILKVVSDCYVYGNQYNAGEFIRNGGVQKGYVETLGIVDGFLSYTEQDEWEALLLS